MRCAYLMIVCEKFVDRERELNRIRTDFERVKRGEGTVVMIEGPAGIGKTELVKEFIKTLSDVEILQSRASVATKYSPYHIFHEALRDYGDLQTIKNEQERRRVRELAQDLIVRPRMVFIDEIENGGGYALYSEITKEVKGLCMSVRMPNNGVWLTGIQNEKEFANPSNIEFEVLPRILDFLKEGGRRVVFIDNINFLIYLNGIERVVEFLHTLYGALGGEHSVIVSGWSEHLTEEEKSKLFSCFEDIISLEIMRRRDREVSVMINSVEEVDSENYVVISSKRGGGKYVVGQGILDPNRIDFEIFEVLSREMENGKDVVVDCVAYLIHYNGVRKVYTWLKSLVDFAEMHSRKVYFVAGPLNDAYQDMLMSIADRSVTRRRVFYDTLTEANAIKFYDTIFGFLDYNSKKRIILMLFEDIQWADKSSLELLRYLARNITHSRIMIIVTYRAEDIVYDEELADIIEDMQGFENVDMMRIRGLSMEGIGELLKVREPAINNEQIKAIYEKSEGNPLLALSLLDYFKGGVSRIPDTIRESVELQLESLDDRTLNFLWLLSAIGERADYEILDMVYPEWKRRLSKIEGRFLKRDDGGLKFKYSIYREIIYENASRDVRFSIHKKLGEIYRKRGDVVEAAKHYYFAKDLKALNLLKKAAEKSVKDIAIKDALDYYKMALEIAIKFNLKDEIIKIYEKVGDYHRIMGEYRKAIHNYEKAIEMGASSEVEIGTKIGECYERLGEYDKALLTFSKYRDLASGLQKGRIAGKIGIVKWHLGDFEEAEMYLDEYLKYAKKYRSAEDEAEAYRNIAIVYYYYSKYDIAIEKAKKALDKAIESGKYDLIANSYNVIGVIYNRQNMPDNALEYFKKYLEIAEKLGNYDYMSKAYNNLALIYDLKGDYEKAKNYYLLSLEMNYKIGNKRDLAISYNNLAVIEGDSGDMMQAIEYMKKSYKYAEEVGDTFNMCGTYLNLGSFYKYVRYYEEARRCFNNALNIAKSESYINEIISAYLYLGDLKLEVGNIEAAEKYIELAERYLRNTEDVNVKMMYNDLKMDYYIAINKINEAEDILEDAIKLAEEVGDEEELMYLARYRARIRCARADYNNAIIYFNKVIDYYKKRNKRKWVAQYYREFAECMEKHDKNAAMEYYREALAIYRSLNVSRWADEIEKRLANLKG